MTAQVTQTVYPQLSVLPLRDVVVFPHMIIPLFVGRQKSIQGLEQAMLHGDPIFLVTQKDAKQENPEAKDLYEVGVVANILQLLRLPDGTVKVLIEGIKRGKVLVIKQQDNMLLADIEIIDEQIDSSKEIDILMRSLLHQFEQYVKLHHKLSPDLVTAAQDAESPDRLADMIAAHMQVKLDRKQMLLATLDPKERLENLMNVMEEELDLMQIEKKVRTRVKDQMEKNHREYYLNEQLKAIQKELGEMDGGLDEFTRLQKAITEAGMPVEVESVAMQELRKLKAMPSSSSEATVSRNYLEWLIDVPWKKKNRIKHDLAMAEKILDEDHYGLEKIKERILEYLAVSQRVKKMQGPILCFVGPPGVGKTSLAKSIARATNRQFTRFALGGVHDDAEIRGHRRTYIGALPGKIIQNLTKVKVKNPLFLLDEIDKMSSNYRGDPASALLEVLDPEQNHAFNDHYLDVDYDLSDVMFICTANSLDIPSPLRDRMEIIRLAGYTEDEKIHIAQQYLVPKQMKANGLNLGELSIDETAIGDIIRYYTREAGVRNLEREIAKICRKVVRKVVSNQKSKEKSLKKHVITSSNLSDYLEVRRYRYGIADEQPQIGQVCGLAWTEVGGELLRIEASIVPGKGKIASTGQLGDVMQESIKAALTVVRSRSKNLGIPQDFYEKNDLHVHVPEGATPKDGPSAGIGMCTALVSSLTNIPVRPEVAMTGEITLRGEVLPIGGLKEKLLAAHRGGIKTVLIPQENEKDLCDIPENVKADLDIRPVRWIDEVLATALVNLPEPLAVPEDENLMETPISTQKTDEPIESPLIRH